MRTCLLPVIASASFALGCGSNDSPPPVQPDGSTPDNDAGADGGGGGPSANFSFFITSTGNPKGGDFRIKDTETDGLAGADAFCRTEAIAGVPAAASRVWHAYLSTDTVNAKDRIGAGPWFNYNGVMIAASVKALLDPTMNLIGKATGLTATGASVPGRGDTPNQHDILTGTLSTGVADATNNCNNWTSSDAAIKTWLGHFDRMGGSDPDGDASSFSTAHRSRGCAVDSFPPTGGRGSIYCFAADDYTTRAR